MSHHEVSFYLGNYRLDNHIANDVEVAAKLIKRDIRFLDTPMPIINPKIKIEKKYVDGFGCIAVFDGKKDCSKFWIAYDKIKKLRDTEKVLDGLKNL